MLIAAGFPNNILLEAACCRVPVKGRTYKESIPLESDDPDFEIEREVLHTFAVALNLRSGRYDVIEYGCTTSTHNHCATAGESSHRSA